MNNGLIILITQKNLRGLKCFGGYFVVAQHLGDFRNTLIHSEFAYAHEIFREVKDTYFKDEPSFKELSMGMSDDYRIAIKEGTTMVRIGSYIFGERNYE